jgi:hypothetical protein
MPYHLEKNPQGYGYFVATKGTERRHSKKALPKTRAIRQMRALYLKAPDSDSYKPGK